MLADSLKQLKLRLKTLLDKKKVMQARSATTSKLSASFVTLEEGFQQFGNDLNKLQVREPLLDTKLMGLSTVLKPNLAICRDQCHGLFQNPEKSKYTFSPTGHISVANAFQWDKTSKVRFLSFALLSFG